MDTQLTVGDRLSQQTRYHNKLLLSWKIKIQLDVFVKYTMSPVATKSIFCVKVKVKVIDIGVIWKGTCQNRISGIFRVGKFCENDA